MVMYKVTKRCSTSHVLIVYVGVKHNMKDKNSKFFNFELVYNYNNK